MQHNFQKNQSDLFFVTGRFDAYDAQESVHSDGDELAVCLAAVTRLLHLSFTWMALILSLNLFLPVGVTATVIALAVF